MFFPIEMVKDYYTLGKPEKAKALARELMDELEESINFYVDFLPEYKSDFEYCCQLVYYLSSEVEKAGDPEFANMIESELAAFLSIKG